MKILVIGGSGVIGSKLVKHFIKNKIEVEFTFLTNKTPYGKGIQLDITKKENTIQLIKKINPDIVIHATALTNVDLCETNKILADSINVNGTRNIIEGCEITKSKIVYISTSFVFDGKNEQYLEEDVMSPTSYYGITKSKGEEIVKQSDVPYLILRTDQPYCWIESWQHTNSVLRTIETLQSGKMFKEIIDWYNNPTYVPEFVWATEKLLQNNESGIFHLVGSDYINRYDWSCKIADIFKLERGMIKPVTSDTLNLPAKRGNVNLNNKKLFHKTGIQMTGVVEGAIKMLETNIHSL